MKTLLARPASRLIHAFRQKPLWIRSTAPLSSCPGKSDLDHLGDCRGIHGAHTPFGKSSILLFKPATTASRVSLNPFTILGARVCVIGRNAHDGAAAVEALRGSGGIATFCRGDVTQQRDMEAAVEAFGGIDILCANAGIFPPTPLEEMSERAWDDVFATNLKGMLFSIQAALPHLKHSAAGRIVLTSSITGPLTGFPAWSHYGATKSGMLGFMRTAALELARFKITINAVLPGKVLTDGVRDLGQAYINTMTASIPLKRLGTVEEIGHAVAFFASEEAALSLAKPSWWMGGKRFQSRRRPWQGDEGMLVVANREHNRS